MGIDPLGSVSHLTQLDQHLIRLLYLMLFAYASHAEYRLLQSCLPARLSAGGLQCLDRSKPPCSLLILLGVTPAYERLSTRWIFILRAFTLQTNCFFKQFVQLIAVLYICHSRHTQCTRRSDLLTLRPSPALDRYLGLKAKNKVVR